MNEISGLVRTVFVALSTVAAAATGGQGVVIAAEMTPELKALAAAADKEGEVIVKWSGGSWGGAKGAKMIEAGINKAYGTKIKIKWTPGGSFPQIGNEIAVAYRSNLPSPTDVYFAFSRNLAVLDKTGLFLESPWGKYDPERLNDRVVERNKFVKMYTGTLGFSYNSELAPSKPERLADFLKPEWKGKFATTPFAAGFEQLAAKEAWGATKTIDYAKAFAKQVAGFMLCTDSERVASGEFLAFVTDCSGGAMIRAAAKGAPIKRVITPDYPMVSYFYFSIPKNARHPNAARLYITYLSSAEGQKICYDTNLIDLHLHPGSRTLAELRAVEKKFGFAFQSADVAWQETNAAGNAAQREVQKILRRSRR